MKTSVHNKLLQVVNRHDELNTLLSDSEVMKHHERFRDLSKEYAQLTPLVNCFRKYQEAVAARNNSQDLLKDSDAELRMLASDELERAEKRIEQLEKELQLLLLPKDPDDAKNIFVEIRAGAGGDEASIFAGDLFRMYSHYAERQHWLVEIVSFSQGEYGGYKEIIARLIGKNVYGRLKFESGVHRVQRVPETEAQGRIHTSTCTVAILPEVEEIDRIHINPDDLRVDTFRASGAGGQHVNRTDSAVRITHLPSGIVVECQDERSQHKNRARAMSLLQAKLLSSEREKQRRERAQTRRDLVGTGDRSERIRTYNFPQNRVTDHRINLTLYKLSDVMVGYLDQLIDPLVQEHQIDLLASVDSVTE
jgi:peptide chain release factor 1